jgi:hypothetical protein
VREKKLLRTCQGLVLLAAKGHLGRRGCRELIGTAAAAAGCCAGVLCAHFPNNAHWQKKHLFFFLICGALRA